MTGDNADTVKVGDVLTVFDSKEWRDAGGDVGDNSQFFHPATIRRVYHSRDRYHDLLADVQFHHDNRLSRGHFVSMMERHATR